MPYVSDAQRRKFHAMAARGELKKKTVQEFDKSSKGMDLPERVKRAFGGEIKVHEYKSPMEGLDVERDEDNDDAYAFGGEIRVPRYYSPLEALEPEDSREEGNFPQPYYSRQGEPGGDAGGYEENPQDDNIPYVRHGYARGGKVRFESGGKVPFLMAVKKTVYRR